MTSPIRKSKRKLGEIEEEEPSNTEQPNTLVNQGDEQQQAQVEATVDNNSNESEDAKMEDSEEVKPPMAKKPRSETGEEVPTNSEGGGGGTGGAKEETKEGEAKSEGPLGIQDADKAAMDKPPEEEKTTPTPAEPAPTTEGAPATAADAASKKPEDEEEASPVGGAGVKKEDSNSMTPTAVAAATMGVARVPPMPAPAPAPPAHPAPIYKEEEYEEPDDGAEIPEDPENIWNARLVELLLYKHQYRTLHVQATYDQSLHGWVDIQRKLYRRHRNDPKSVSALTQLRLTALDAINFPFTLRGAAHWDRYFAKLQEFNKKHGHCLVPRLCEFAGLGDWVIDQRRQYKLMMQGKPSVLDPERQRKLEELGFVWVVRNRPEWNNRYQELIQYREKYGDTKVPQHYKEIPGLGKWVAKQREQYRLLQQGKHSFLTPDRLEKLNEAGFVWSVRKDGAEDMAALASKKKPVVQVVKKETTVAAPPAPAAVPTATTAAPAPEEGKEGPKITEVVEPAKAAEEDNPGQVEPAPAPAPVHDSAPEEAKIHNEEEKQEVKAPIESAADPETVQV